MFQVEVKETSQHKATITMNSEVIGRIDGSKITMPGYTLTVSSWQEALDWSYRMFDDVHMTYCDEHDRYQEQRVLEVETGLS